MSRAAIENAKRITPALFGDTDIAGGIPHELRPLPSDGPVYFEGQLVLALSFQGGEGAACSGEGAANDEGAARGDAGVANGVGVACDDEGAANGDGTANGEGTARNGDEGVALRKGRLLDELSLRDVLTETWFEPSPRILRYEGYDVVLIDEVPVFCGIVDNTRDVTLVPGWDSACTAINNRQFLRWESAFYRAPER